ncbi:clc-4, partial [Pristionchus pacificus]
FQASKQAKMCSFITQIAYGIMMLITLGLTAGGLFSENWVQSNGVNKGLFCSTANIARDGKQSNVFCDGWWDNLKAYERTVVVCLFIAIVFQVFALVWNFITICACCCKKHIIHPLSAISVLNVIAIAIAVIVFAINSSSAINDFSTFLAGGNRNPDGSIGSSFVMECVALGMAILCTIVASLAICFAEKCV